VRFVPNVSGGEFQTAMKIPSKTNPDYATFAGIAVASACIIGGLILEKGRIADLAQLTAALIVFGGTAGAVLISTPVYTLMNSLKRARTAFFDEARDKDAQAEQLLRFAWMARRGGLVSIEDQAAAVDDSFTRNALLMAVDGMESKEIRRQLEMDIRITEERAEDDAQVFELAGGYAPTIGIIGAVLGLIRVMNHLENIGSVGKGIAIAFVSTLYGVGLANLLLLPLAAKIRSRLRDESHRRELIMEGVLAITEGVNPKLMRNQLENFAEGNRQTTATPAPSGLARAAASGAKA
jgi:chemotaxis protein MotA